MVSGSLDVCLQLPPLICLPVWQVVPGSPDVSLYWSPFIFSLCACGVRLSGCVFLLVSFCLPPRLAGGVGPFGCLSLILFVYLLFPIIWLPFWLVVSGSLDVSLHLFPFICLPCCLVVSGCPDVFCVFSLVSHRVPLAMCLPIFPSPN